MTTELIEKIIRILEGAKKSPGMFIGGYDPHYVKLFLSGLYQGLRLFVDPGFEQMYIRNELARTMGLKSTSHTKDLKEQGYSDKEVIDKLFTLEIDAWNILLDK